MIRQVRGLYLLFIYIFLLSFLNIAFASDNTQSKKPELKVRFPVADKTDILTEEQTEKVYLIYSDFEDYSSIQFSLLIVNSPDDTSGENFLTKYSGQSKQRIVIRLVTSTKEVGLFWTEALNSSLQTISQNYRSKFEPYLSEGKFYEAALYGSLELIKVLSPDYNLNVTKN